LCMRDIIEKQRLISLSLSLQTKDTIASNETFLSFETNTFPFQGKSCKNTL
jgi:hypothetical protein